MKNLFIGVAILCFIWGSIDTAISIYPELRDIWYQITFINPWIVDVWNSIPIILACIPLVVLILKIISEIKK